MITYTSGNILNSQAQALVNTVNTVGVMGKGLALQFKRAYPDMFKSYEAACARGEVKVGEVWPYRHETLAGVRHLINFPTKEHWKTPSKIEYIYEGLKSLVRYVIDNKITSIAIPPLGCGNGGLPWPAVKRLIEDAFMGCSANIVIYEPSESIEYAAPDMAQKPHLTVARASILDLMFQFQELGYDLTWLSVQKLCYLLQTAGEDLKLRYTKYVYGPYADNLRHMLLRLEGYYIKGMYDGNNLKPYTYIEPLAQHKAEIDSFLSLQNEHADKLKRVKDLIYGYESPYSLELLTTVHWTVHKDKVGQDLPSIVESIHNWNPRKARLMKPEHIGKAYQQLLVHGWI